MDSDSLQRLLIDLGLTPTEAIVYLATVTLDGGTTKQISVAAGKERAQTHHALSKLQQLGIVDSTLETPTTFRPAKIREAFDHLFKMQSLKLRKLGERREELENVLQSRISKSTPVQETYSIVKGRANTYLKMIESIQVSEKEVCLILSAQGLTRLRRFRNFVRTVQSKQRKGVKFRIISEIIPENIDDANLLSKSSELRHIRNQITNASIYDGKIASVALSISEDLNLDAENHIALWTSAQSFAKTLTNFFDSVWFVAAPIQPTIRLIEAEITGTVKNA
jgi:sugar-specific transcriptional regulator TrmB